MIDDAGNWQRWLVRGSALAPASPPLIDFHMHTDWTDGDSTLAEMVGAAKVLGLQAIAITEHVNFSTNWYESFTVAVRSLREAETQLAVYFGIEVTILDYGGTLKTHLTTVDLAELVMGVVHSYPKHGGGFWRFDELTAEQALDLEIAGLLGLAQRGEVDIIGHPGGTYWRRFGAFPVERLEPVFRRAAEADIAIDLNAAYCWDLPGLLELLRRTDPLVALGSDAHHQAHVGGAQRLLLESGAADIGERFMGHRG